MSLLLAWFLLFLAWVTGTLAMIIWPDPDPARQALLSETGISFMFQPFHYLASGLLLLFFMAIFYKLWSRMTYEWRLSFFMGRISWQVICLTLLMMAIQWRLVEYFGWPVVVSLLVIVLCDLFHTVKK